MSAARKSAGQLIAAAAKKYEAHHYAFGPGEATAAIAAGRRFFSVTGDPLPTLDAVREAMRRDKEVVSR